MSLQKLGEYAITCNEHAGEGAIVHEADTARRAARLQHRSITPACSFNLLPRPPRTSTKRRIDTLAKLVDDLGVANLGTLARCGQATELLGTNRNHLVTLKDTNHMLVEIVSTVVLACHAEQACAYRDTHASRDRAGA